MGEPVYVYLLSDYGEYGSENMVGTLDRSKLAELVDSRAADYDMDHVVEAQAAIAKLLERPDSELADGSSRISKTGAQPHNLMTGWGGMQLHVVRLT